MQPTVWVLDNNPEQRHMLKSLVSMFHYSVQELPVCLNTFHQYHAMWGTPDLVIVDASGESATTDLILQLREHHVASQVIAMVKYGDYDTIRAAMAYGALDFLMRPIPVERLKVTLRNALTIKRIKDNVVGKGVMADSETLPLLALEDKGHMRSLAALEEDIIRIAMQYYRGRLTEVAKRLGIGRSTLYRKLHDMQKMLSHVA